MLISVFKNEVIIVFNAGFQLTKVVLMPRSPVMWAASLPTTCQKIVVQNLVAGNPDLLTLL